MKTDCKDLEYVLREGSPELLKTLTAHAEICPACKEQLERWNELSKAARAMHRNWNSPALWPRIHQALAAESQSYRTREWAPRSLLRSLGSNWRAVTAAAAVLLLTASVAMVLMRNFRPAATTDPEAEKRLLTEKALREIEANESAYVQSIDKLSRLVEPRIENSSSPLLVSYREKLTLIDAAIAECRANIERNRFNAHLRRDLISIYQEKQRTLEDLMRIDKNDLQ